MIKKRQSLQTRGKNAYRSQLKREKARFIAQ